MQAVYGGIKMVVYKVITKKLCSGKIQVDIEKMNLDKLPENICDFKAGYYEEHYSSGKEALANLEEKYAYNLDVIKGSGWEEVV